MSADMSTDGELNRQQRNPYSSFNFGMPQQGQQGFWNIEWQSNMDILSKWFLIFSVVSFHSMRTVWNKTILNKNLLLCLNNISIVILLLRHLQNSLCTFLLLFFIERCVVARSWNGIHSAKDALREKCPNMEFFLIRIFLYSDIFHAMTLGSKR